VPAGFDALADRYLEWLRAHEAAGWRFEAGETERRAELAALGGIALEGRLDRIDRGAHGGAMLIDYKTGQPEKLKQALREPLEDTQLAFYAALLGESVAPQAIYLALAGREAPQALEHPDVGRSAALLVEGLAADLDALRSGEPAPALGQGDACRFCDARGLCRRDHWPDAT
jgi:ATP-dependent helicase/nuclease subunit B